MNVNDKNNNTNIEKPLDSIRDEYTKKEKSPSKIKAFAQPMILNKTKGPSTNTSREPIFSRLKELLSTADKIAPNKDLQSTSKNALSILKKSKHALDIALRADKDICDRLTDIAQKQLSPTPLQQCRELRDMERYLILLSDHANASEFLAENEKLQFSFLIKEVRETIIRFSQATAPNWTTHLDQLEALIKETLPPKKVLPNVPSILNTHQGIELDDRTFASILLESMISGSRNLEGNSTAKVVHYLKTFLETNKDQYSQIIAFPALLKMITDADAHLIAYEGLSKQINPNYFSRDFNKVLSAFHQSLSKLVKELAPGEKTLIPIGWTGKEGHSMEMGIEKEIDGSLRAIIYNAGAGLDEYHPMLFEKGEAFYQPFIELSGIKEERLLEFLFSKALLEMLLISHNPSKEGGETHYGPKDIYEIILNSLAGKIDPCRGEREKFMPPQFSGICTWASLLAVLHTILPKQDYYKIVSDIALDSICSYYQSMKDQLATNEESRNMLQHAAVTCAQINLESYQNKGISLESLQTTLATLKDLQTMLEAAEAQSDYNKISEELLAFEKLEPTNPKKIFTSRLHLNPKFSNKPFSLPTTEIGTPSPPFSFEWINDPTQIEKGLNQLIKHIHGSKSAEGAGNGVEGARCMEMFFRLQSKEGMEDIWNKIPEDQLSAVTVELADLGELLFEATDAFPNNIREYTVYAYYISALNLLLSQRNPDLQQYVADNGIQYVDYNKAVTSSLDGSLVEDQNLFNPEDRILRKKALEILKSQKKMGNHLKLDSTLEKYSAKWPYSTCEMRYVNEQLEKNPSLIAKLEAFFEKNPFLILKFVTFIPQELKTDRDWQVDLKTDRDLQVAVAICDLYGHVMPPAFCALRRQALTAATLLSKKFVTIEEEKDTFKLKIKEENNGCFTLESLKASTKNVKTSSDFVSDMLFNQLVEMRNQQNDSKLSSDFVSDMHLNQVKELVGMELQNKTKGGVWAKIYDSENDVMLRPLDEWKKNLLLILTQGDMNEKDQFLEQQVIKTISYFSDHMDKLADHDMRMLCRFLLFDENHLERILEKNPAACKLLARFVQKGYHNFVERENISGAAYFIEIGRDLEAIPLFNKNEIIFPNIRQLCLDLLSQREWNYQERTLIYQQIAASYTSHPSLDFSPEDATLLLTALLQDEVFALSEYKTTGHLRDQIQRAFWMHARDIQKQLMSAEGANICHAIVRTFEASAVQQPWDCTSHYPLCISKDGLYMINAKNFMIHIKNNPVVPLPRNLLSSKDFCKLFSKKNYLAHKTDWRKYEFTDERGIATTFDGIAIRQKFDDGYWYEFTSKNEQEAISSLPKDFQNLCDNSFLWVPSEPEAPLQIVVKNSAHQITHIIPLMKMDPLPNLSKDQQKEIYEFLIGKTQYGAQEEIVRNKILTIPEFYHYFRKLLSEKEASLLRAESLNVLNVKKKIDEISREDVEIDKFMTNPPVNHIMELVQQLLPAFQHRGKYLLNTCRKENGSDLPWYLVDLQNSPNIPVKQLFKEGMLWKDEQGVFKELELPLRGLCFKMQKKGKIWQANSVEHPGYFVSPNQRYRGLTAVPGAIVLENKSEKKRLILPYGKIEPKQTGSFATTLEILVDTKTTTPSISYDLDSISRPIANNKEQQVYLANILLMQKKYEQAQALLRASFSNIIPYNSKELLLLDQIARLPNAAEDNSPHAAAVACTALALIRLSPASNPKEKLPELDDVYLNYKKQAGVVPHLKLTHDEEKMAFGFEMLGNQDYARYPKPKTIKNSITSSAGSLYHSINDKSLPIEPQALMLTRPQKYFRKGFLGIYALALKDPIKLELFISAAAQDPKSEHVPADLITLLRSTAYCIKTLKSYKFGLTVFPPSLNTISALIETKHKGDNEFSLILEQAQAVEAHILKEKAADQKPIVITGTANTYLRPLEAQKIGQRSDITSIDLTEVPQRKSILKPNQLDAAASTINETQKNSETGFFEETPNYGLQFNVQEISELQRAIKGSEENKSSVEAQERSSNINTYWSNPEHAAIWHALKPEKLSNIKTLLLVEQAEMGKRLKLLEQELLGFTNDLSPDIQEALLFEMEKMGNIRQPISLRDIIIFTARASHFSLSGKNPQLASYEKELLNKSISYFDAKAQQQQLVRAIASINVLEKAMASIEDTEKVSIVDRNAAYARLSELCYKELTRKAPYNADEHPELLMFEVLEEIGLHDWQVKDLERMLRPKKGENSNIILEKVMGSGKTKVYLPLLALSKADGEHIPFIVVHSSQYDSVAPTLQIKSGQNFSQVAHTLKFSRDSDTSLEALQKILNECLLVQKQRHFFVVTDKSMHSLSLAFTQLWDNYLTNDKEDSSLAARIEVFREIINLLKTKGKAILDEADLLLNCRFEVVYSLGDPQPIKGAHADLVADLYSSIASHLETFTPFTETEYLAKKPELIQSFIDQVVARDMQECDKKKIFDYLNGGKEGATYVDTLPDEQRNLLAIAFYEFDELLPIVLDRRCNEHFGYSTNPDKILPVPYVASGVPSPTAEFSFPYALLDYAVQTLKSDGVTPSLLKRLIQEMQSRASKEQKSDSTLALQDTLGYQAFYELCGKDRPFKVSIPFLKVNDSDIAKLVKLYKENPPDIYAFAKKHIFPAVTIHPRKLVSTPYTLGNMFYEKQGFTGTPWNNKTFPKDLETIRDINSAGKTEGIIWKNSQVVHTLTEAGFENSIEAIHNIHKTGKYHACIDVGAMFNGYDNQTVAATLLETLPLSIKGVLFFKDNRACVLERGKKDPVYFEQGGSTENLYIFYDQWHTTGTDFPIAGKSLLSIGKNTKMRDLEQGYMRDRQAAQGKRVEFILPKESRDYMKKELQLPKAREIGTAEILRCVQLNQDSELNEQLMMASFGRIKETVNNHLQSMLLNPAIPPHIIREKGNKIRHLIGDNMKDSPYEDFGRYKEGLNAKEFFFAFINKTAEEMKEFIEDKALCPVGLSTETLIEELWGCIDLHLLPAKLSAAAKNAPNQLIEQQSQQEVQQERMAMVNKELLTDVDLEKRNGPIHWNFDSSQGIYSRSFYRVIDPESLSKESLPLLDNTSSPWIPKSQGQTPFMPISKIFAANESLKEFSDVFDIEASYNFLPVKGNARKNKNFIPVQTAPFQKGYLIVKNVLICKDKQTGAVQVRLLSQADAGFFFNHLADHPAMEKDREIDATLYHLSLKVYQSNNEAIAMGTENVLEGPVLRKIVQAKFFNGESIYTKEESVYLGEWIKEKGQGRMKRLFMEHILPSKKEDNQQEYPGSILSKLFSA